jgi:hypothetical protein
METGAFFGRPNSPQIEAEVAAWFDARTPDEERATVRRLNRLAFAPVIYAPLGQYLRGHGGTCAVRNGDASAAFAHPTMLCWLP